MRAIHTGIILLFAIGGLLYFVGSYAARRIVQAGLETVRPQLSERGIILNALEYGDIRLQSIRAFSVHNIDLDFYLEKPIYDKDAFHALFRAERAVFKITRVKNLAFVLEIDDFDLELKSMDGQSEQAFGKFEHAHWRGVAPLRFYSLESSVQLVAERIRTLFRTNSIPDPMFFSGDARLNLDGKSAMAHLYTVREDGRTFLRVDETSILAAADTFELKMAPATAALIARHPAKAAHLIKITRDAMRAAENLTEADAYTRDAYKHILWSYLLTRAFGPEFAKTFTDTHETKPGNTPGERRMDFRNNTLGRQYAEEGVAASELLKKLEEDPAVVLEPG